MAFHPEMYPDTKVVIYLSNRAHKEILELGEMIGSGGIHGTIRKAVSLLRLLTKEKERGVKIILEERKRKFVWMETTRKELILK